MYIVPVIISMITFISADHSKYFQNYEKESYLWILSDVFITIEVVAGKPVIGFLFSVFDAWINQLPDVTHH